MNRLITYALLAAAGYFVYTRYIAPAMARPNGGRLTTLEQNLLEQNVDWSTTEDLYDV